MKQGPRLSDALPPDATFGVAPHHRERVRTHYDAIEAAFLVARRMRAVRARFDAIREGGAE